MEDFELFARKYLLSLAPELHLDDTSFQQIVDPLPWSPQQREETASWLAEEGYFHWTADWGLDIRSMAATVRAMTEAGLPPVLCLLYDEFWVPLLKLRPVLADLLGEDFLLLPDFWIWNVDPKKGQAGWKPHRDKGRESLLEDGSPKSLSLWIPLSEATPLNGCMYLVPRSQDPTYGTAEEKDWQFQYAGIRALPARPGDFLIWNQAILHWGGRTSPRAKESRISISFEVQRADVAAYNFPLLKPSEIPPFEMRLRLIAKQILQYRHMYPLDLAVGLAASRLVFYGSD